MNNINYSDFNNICRICMLSCEIKFVQNNVISGVFYKLTDIHFETKDELPQHICQKCFNKINEIYEFAIQCKRTHASLLKCINDFKNAQMNKEQETLEGINVSLKTEEEIDDHEIDGRKNEPFKIKTEEEILIDKHEIVFIKDEVLCSASKFVIAEVNIKEDIVEDKNNELEKNMNPGTSDDKNINYSKDDLLEQNSTYIKVENEEESNDNINLNDSNENTCSLDISDSSYIDSAEYIEDIFKKTKGKYKCDVCNKTYIQLASFKKHKSLPNCAHKWPHKSRNVPYKCEQCSMSFLKHLTFKNHMRKHRVKPKRLFQCSQCSKSFKQLACLKFHMFTHSRERPYKCEYCCKSFLHSYTLKIHTCTHSN